MVSLKTTALLRTPSHSFLYRWKYTFLCIIIDLLSKCSNFPFRYSKCQIIWFYWQLLILVNLLKTLRFWEISDIFSNIAGGRLQHITLRDGVWLLGNLLSSQGLLPPHQTLPQNCLHHRVPGTQSARVHHHQLLYPFTVISSGLSQSLSRYHSLK